MREENPAAAKSYTMTPESIAAYLREEQNRGASENAMRRCRRVTSFLYEWLPDDKILTKDLLLAWRQSLKDHGYTPKTELNYVKGVNRYLDYMGFSDIRFNRGRTKDLTGKQFGYLTAIEPTGEKNRKDYIWRCRCKCGKEVEFPATRLLTGNTVSCGCLRGAHFKEANKYIGGTSLRQSLEEQVHSTRAMSGYTGVTVKRGKWKAYIKYKGRDISLGCYDKLEDAVKARARGKELVQMDALGLLDFYEELHKDDPALPDRTKVRAENKQPKQDQPESHLFPALRSNNTSGHPGVHRKRNKWAAKITWQRVTYQLGSYKSIEEAIAIRQAAEKKLADDPFSFPDWALTRQVGKQEIE
ncbi:MAG: hypothetical protein IKT52_01300 [Oscillospiraceae bacterium]|nr:hypothetical protein [Oscillospiraceae bacterium]